MAEVVIASPAVLEMSGGRAQPFDVPWRVRDALRLIGATAGVTIGLMLAYQVALGVLWAAQHGGAPSLAEIRALLQRSAFSELYFFTQSALGCLFLWLFILRPYRVSVRRFFAPPVPAAVSSPLAAPQPDASGALGEEARQVGRYFLILFGVLLAVVMVVAAVLWATAGASGHPAARQVVDQYLAASQRETHRLVRADISWLMITGMILIAPPLEELVFHGCLYGALRRRWSPWSANLCSSGLFALCHAYAINLLNVLVIGVTLAYVYERTRSLRVTTVLHLLMNLVVVSVVRPWLWLAGAAVGVAVWGLWWRAHRRRPDGTRRGWKMYAVVLALIYYFGELVIERSPWPMIAVDTIVMAAAALYAWRLPAGPRVAWRLYGLGYLVWLGLGIWASTIPLELRAPWQQMMTTQDVLRGSDDVLLEIVGTCAIIGPAVWAVFQMASGRPATSRFGFRRGFR